MPPGRLNRRHLIAGTAALLAGGMRSATAQEEEPEVRRGGVPLIALPRLPERLLDPADDRWEAAWLRSLAYDAPLRASASGLIVPAAAIGGFSADSRVYELAPRPDAIFSDGAPVAAADIAASVERAILGAAPGDAWRWEHVEGIDVSDANRVQVVLAQPDATLPATLASWGVPVTPEGAGGAGTELADLPPGTGPFSPSLLEEGRLHLRANRAHWVIGQPRFDGAAVIAVDQEIERTSRLVTGLVDIVPDVPALDIPLLRNDPGIRLHGGVSRRQCAVLVNMTREPLNDVRVRQLLAGCIDREALVEGAMAGRAVPSGALVPPDHWAGVPTSTVPTPPPVRETRDRFAALGLLPGWQLRLLCPDDAPTLANTAILLQEELGAVGIDLGIDLLDRDAMTAARDAGEFDLVMELMPLWIDPHEVAYPWLHSTGARNAGGFATARVDRLLALARATTDLSSRGSLYVEVQRIVADQVPLIPLFLTPWYDGVRERVAGYTEAMPPSGRGVASSWFTLA